MIVICWYCCNMFLSFVIMVTVGGLVNQRADAAPPTFATSQFVTTLYELEQTQKTLVNFNCTDPDPSDDPVVSFTSVSPSNPCGKCFVVYPASECNGVKYCLKYIPGRGDGPLNSRTASEYDITVTCSDGNTTDTAKVNVRLTVNTPPRFNPNQFVATHTLNNTKTVKSGATVYDVNAVDDNNDNILYSMTSVPASSFFQIGAGDGEIRATQDLGGLCLQTITFYVNITDNINPSVGPLAVHVNLDGSNVAPDITNLNEDIQVPEDSATGTVIQTIAATDDAAVSRLTYTFSASPSANLAFFEVTGQDIKVKSALNYESGVTARFTNLTITANDEQGCTSSPHYLYVTVTDVNEPPDLRPGHAVYSVYEGSDFGTPALSIPWTVVEQDQIDRHTYKIVDGNGQNLFNIDSTTGQLSVTTDYDIDMGRMPTSQTLTIQVTDKGGLTDNATVVLQFKDRNDNAPKISAATSAFSVCETTNSGSTLGTLTCTDKDSNFQGNNATQFTASGTGVTVLATGGIVLSQRPPVGQTYTAVAHCRDNGQFPGSLQSRTPVHISVTGIVCPTVTPVTQAPTQAPATTAAPTTTTTTTTAAPATTAAAASGNALSWIEENLPWIIVAALLLTALLGLLAYLSYIYCWRYCQRCCRRKPRARRVTTPPRRITPVEEPPLVVATIPEPYIYNFWTEKFSNNNYGKQPNRDSNPRPVTPAAESNYSALTEQNRPPAKKRSCCTIL